MEKYGYDSIDEDNSGKERPMATKDMKSAIKKIQFNAGMQPTGNLDDETVRLLKSPRCGVKDNNAPRIILSKRFVAAGDKMKCN